MKVVTSSDITQWVKSISNSKVPRPFPSLSSEVKSRALARLVTDLRELEQNPVPSMSAAPLEDNMFVWHCNLVGSPNTEYAGVSFHLVLLFPDNYPTQAPSVRFLTYINHMSVLSGGNICLNMLSPLGCCFRFLSNNNRHLDTQ